MEILGVISKSSMMEFDLDLISLLRQEFIPKPFSDNSFRPKDFLALWAIFTI